jgi:hypothetical protein
MALALVLLVASGLMLRSFHSLHSANPGFGKPEDVLSFQIYIPTQEVQASSDVATSFEAMARRLAQIPGVEAVGLATGIPMDGWGNVNPFYVRGQVLDPDGPRISRRHKWIGPNYLSTLWGET